MFLAFAGALVVFSFVNVCSVYHCLQAWGQIPVQRHVASAHAQAMAGAYVVLEVLLA